MVPPQFWMAGEESCCCWLPFSSRAEKGWIAWSLLSRRLSPGFSGIVSDKIQIEQLNHGSRGFQKIRMDAIMFNNFLPTPKFLNWQWSKDRRTYKTNRIPGLLLIKFLSRGTPFLTSFNSPPLPNKKETKMRDTSLFSIITCVCLLCKCYYKRC